LKKAKQPFSIFQKDKITVFVPILKKISNRQKCTRALGTKARMGSDSRDNSFIHTSIKREAERTRVAR